LAKFKGPKIVEIRKELPKSATGKILRRLLK
jgi:acyl-CoA synthetase (AMP-forming)/AMP-acid ligase II